MNWYCHANQNLPLCELRVYVCVYVCVCVYTCVCVYMGVCVCVRERETVCVMI